MPDAEGKLTREEKNANRGWEDIAPETISMDESKLVGQNFKGLIEKIKTGMAFKLDADGNPLTEKGKQARAEFVLDVDFLEDPERFTFGFWDSNSKSGMKAKFLDALKKVRVVTYEGEDTGKVGIPIKNVMQLEGQIFSFERRDIDFGMKNADGTPNLINFPMPIIYWLPLEEKPVEEVKVTGVKKKLV